MKQLSIKMTAEETKWGWIYFALDLFVLPLLLVSVNTFLPNPLSSAALNILLYVLNFLCVAVIFRIFLLKSLLFAKENLVRCLRFAVYGLAIYYAGNLLFSELIAAVRPDFMNVNDQNIAQMFQQYPVFMNLCTILLVPITEEALFRGLLFQGIYNKNKIAAYAVSVIGFAAVHVVAYLGKYDAMLLALCFLQYLPAGLALCWAYAKSDSIWSPILMHITINQIAVTAMR